MDTNQTNQTPNSTVYCVQWQFVLDGAHDTEVFVTSTFERAKQMLEQILIDDIRCALNWYDPEKFDRDIAAAPGYHYYNDDGSKATTKAAYIITAVGENTYEMRICGEVASLAVITRETIDQKFWRLD